MSREEILNTIKGILTGDEFVILDDVAADITEETSLINDMALDSLQILNLVVLIENKFGFECDEEELNLDLFNRMSELIDFIISKVGGE